MRFIIYGSERCTYCQSAKDLLDHKGMAYEYIDINEDEQAKETIIKQGHRTVPQVYTFGGEHIGGYQELVKHLSG